MAQSTVQQMMVSGLTIATTSRTDGNHKSKTIRVVEVRSLRRSPAKHIDLLPQDQVFRFRRCSRLEARSQDTENKLEHVGNQDASLRRPLAASTPNRILGTHREFLVCKSAMLFGKINCLPEGNTL